MLKKQSIHFKIIGFKYLCDNFPQIWIVGLIVFDVNAQSKKADSAI